VRKYNEAFPNFRFLDFDNFRKQLDFFDRTHGFVTFEEWCRYLSDGSMPSIDGKVLLTFDDAMSCHFRYVFPELRSRNLWGIFYVPTSPYTDRRIVDVHRIHLLCGAFEGKRLLEYALSIVSEDMIPSQKRDEFEKETYANQVNYEGVSEFKRVLNYFIDHRYRSEVIDAIGRRFGFDFDVSTFYMTTDQIAEMAAENMLIGSHTKSHPVMSTLSADEQSVEIESSFDFLSSICKLPLRTYCHPYGGFHSFNNDTIRLLRHFEVDFSFNVESREINSRDKLHSIQYLPRFDCNQFQFGSAS
ncbi:MAG: polysaccharide deacetylase family protein, partial [Candidatus Acidiferrales bacterium]